MYGDRICSIWITEWFNEKEPFIYEEKKDIDSNGIDYYKELLRAKKTNEKILQQELYKCAEAISVSKKEKEKYLQTLMKP